MSGKNGCRSVGSGAQSSSLLAKATWNVGTNSLRDLVTHIMYADVTEIETEGENISLPEKF